MVYLMMRSTRTSFSTYTEAFRALSLVRSIICAHIVRPSHQRPYDEFVRNTSKKNRAGAVRVRMVGGSVIVVISNLSSRIIIVENSVANSIGFMGTLRP